MINKRSFTFLFFAVSALMTLPVIAEQETLLPLIDGNAPQTFEEMWQGYDPRSEPLDIEVLNEWQEDGVVMRVVRYRIGIFKGQKTMMAAIYGYPMGGRNLPGLVQIHGGGQYADYRAVLTNAKRGYATISISWAGRISAPGYKVNPDVVKLFWANKTDDPDYKLTTDWGVLDGYHAPCRNPKNSFGKIAPASWTLDSVESPRNSSWFLCVLGSRRAITFLERQPEVDSSRLGVYGHSMGGKLTVMTAAADDRIKAAAPSCGGISNRGTDNMLYNATIADDVNLSRITCPIIFLSPSNDFHGRIDDLQKAVTEIASKQWRVTCSPHHNHQDTGSYEVATQLWFDQHLKNKFTVPGTPQTSLDLRHDSGIPSFTVKPDASRSILCVDIYYTQQGQKAGEKDNRENTKNKFWHHAKAISNGNSWTADLPVLSVDRPLWVYANVVYPIDEPITGAGYYYSPYTTSQFNISSIMHIVTAEQLKANRVRATVEPSWMIETFEGDWDKEWFTYSPEQWGRKTHKIYEERWKAPPGAKIAIEIRSERPNKIVIGIDQYVAEIQLTGESKWQRIVLAAEDFQNVSGKVLPGWKGIKEFRFAAQENLREKVGGKNKTQRFGASWKGKSPQFRNLQWITEQINGR